MHYIVISCVNQERCTTPLMEKTIFMENYSVLSILRPDKNFNCVPKENFKIYEKYAIKMSIFDIYNCGYS